MTKKVEVITLFLEDGTIKPIRLRLVDEDGEFRVFNIKIIDREVDKKISIVKFKIKININGVDKVCKLLFYGTTYEWYLDI